MIWKALRFALLLSLGAVGAYGLSRLNDGDTIDRHAQLLAARGQSEQAVILSDVKGILGKTAAVALASAAEADYPALKTEALRLSREVVAGRLEAPKAEKEFLAEAAPSCLKAQDELLHAIKTAEDELVLAIPEARPYAPELARTLSQGLGHVLLFVPELRVRVGAATAMAASASPDKPNMIEALEAVAKQAM